MPADGPVGVVAQSLDIGDSDQEQIQRPAAVVSPGQVVVADQSVVHPTETRGNAPQPLGLQQLFGDHEGWAGVDVGVVCGSIKLRMFSPRSNSWRAVWAMSSCNVL